MTLAKRICCLFLLLNVATYVLSSVTSTSSPPLSSSPSPSASASASGAVAEQKEDMSENEVGVGGDGRGRAFYHYNGTAMVNTTTVAITLAFYSVIALGIYSLVAGAAAEQMAEFIEVAQVEDVFKVAADTVFIGNDLEREDKDKESVLGYFKDPKDGYSLDQVKKYNTEYGDHEAVEYRNQGEE